MVNSDSNSLIRVSLYFTENPRPGGTLPGEGDGTCRQLTLALGTTVAPSLYIHPVYSYFSA